MYASNEDEFNGEEKDWVFLPSPLPSNAAVHEPVNVLPDLDNDDDDSSSSSSSSSSSDSSVKSIRTDSLSSTELEPVDNEDQVAEHDTISAPVDIVVTDEEPALEIKEETLPPEISMPASNENESTPIFNEYELPMTEPDTSESLLATSIHLRQRIGAHIDQADPPVVPPPEPIFEDRPAQRPAIVVIFYILLLLLSAKLLIPKQMEPSEGPAVGKWEKPNEHADNLKQPSISDIEEKLSKQLDEKFQKAIHEKLAKYEQEKVSLLRQMGELHQLWNRTQANVSKTMDQLAGENNQLREQVKALEQRLLMNEQQSSKAEETKERPEGVRIVSRCGADRPMLNWSSQDVSEPLKTPVNLSTLVDHWSGLLGSLFDRREKFIERSKRKLSDLARSASPTKSNNAIWIRSRAEHREQARIQARDDEQKNVKHPWRWTFQRGHDRERMRHQTPVKTNRSGNKKNVCQSRYEFPVPQICAMKKWIERYIRP